MSKITAIKRIEGETGYDGLRIEMENGGYVELRIDNDQSCCEVTGAIYADDDLTWFVGANFIGAYMIRDVDFKAISPADEENTMFVDFKTDRGVFQAAVYNIQNGHYGHTATLDINGIVIMNKKV